MGLGFGLGLGLGLGFGLRYWMQYPMKKPSGHMYIEGQPYELIFWQIRAVLLSGGYMIVSSNVCSH